MAALAVATAVQATATTARAADGVSFVGLGSPPCTAGVPVTIQVEVRNASTEVLTVQSLTFGGSFDQPPTSSSGDLRVGAQVGAGTNATGSTVWLASASGQYAADFTVVLVGPSGTQTLTARVPVACADLDTTTVVPSPSYTTVPSPVTTMRPGDGTTVTTAPGATTTDPVVLGTTVPVGTTPASPVTTSRPATTRPGSPSSPAPTTKPGDATSSPSGGSASDPVLATNWEKTPRQMQLDQKARISVVVFVREDGVTPSVETSAASAVTTIVTLGRGCKVRASVGPTDAFEIAEAERTLEFDACDGAPDHLLEWRVKPVKVGSFAVSILYQIGSATRLSYSIDIEVTDAVATTSAKLADVPDVPATEVVVADAGDGPGVVVILAIAAALAAAVVVGVAVRSRRRRALVPATTAAPVVPVQGERAKVFLSYSRHDASEVTRIEDELDASGFDTWRDIDDIAGGTAWRSAIAEALDSSIAVVLLLSPSAMASTNVAREIALADDAGRPIVPVLIDGDGKLTGTFRYILADTQIIDVRSAARSRGMRQLVQALHAKDVRRSLPPPVATGGRTVTADAAVTPPVTTLPPPGVLPPPTLTPGE